MHSSTPRRHTHAPAAVVYHRRPAAGAPATRPRCRTHTLTTSKSAIASLPHAHHPPSRVVRGALLRDDHGNGPRRALGSNACARNNRSSRAVVPHAAAAAPSTTGSADAVLKGRSVAVVGGGPAGMLAAAHLAKLGGTVTVFERQSPQDQRIPPSVWAICLGRISYDAIAAADLSPDFGAKWTALGSSLQAPGRPPKFVGPWVDKDADDAGLTYSMQPRIVEHLRAEIGRVYGTDAVRVENSVRVVGGDVCAGELVAEASDGSRRSSTFDLVVGADGVSSLVRALVADTDPSFTVNIPEAHTSFLPLSFTPKGDPTTYSNLPTPSGSRMQITPPTVSDSGGATCTAYFPAGPNAEPGIQLLLLTIWAGGDAVGALFGASGEWFAAERPAPEWLAALEAAFPGVPSVWLQEAAETLAGGSLRVRTPKFVSCSKLGSGRAVLVGDAAHAVSPNVAAGCNAGLQDGAVLAEAVKAAGGDLDAVADLYSAARLEDAQAITRISRQVDDVLSYAYHGDLQRALRAAPIAATLILSGLPKDSSWPEALRPKASFNALMQASDSFSQVDRDAQQLFGRLLAAIATPVVVVAIAAAGIALSH